MCARYGNRMSLVLREMIRISLACESRRWTCNQAMHISACNILQLEALAAAFRKLSGMPIHTCITFLRIELRTACILEAFFEDSLYSSSSLSGLLPFDSSGSSTLILKRPEREDDFFSGDGAGVESLREGALLSIRLGGGTSDRATSSSGSS